MALTRIPGLGPRGLERLRNRFGSYESLWDASINDLQEFLSPQLLQSWLEIKKIDPGALGCELEAKGIEVVAHYEPNYPELLRQTAGHPPVLYCKGNTGYLQLPQIAVVGSRMATTYGRKVARRLANQLAEAGLAVTSGMARGIDAEAHWGCLEAGGVTLGVLGNGIDVVYPRENKVLYERVEREGLLVTEFAPGTPPEPVHFPIRNRIISGMSLGVVVVEARIKSGAMITVDFALEQGRDVFAVPGPVTSLNSEGTNQLIKNGARVVTRIEDILEELRLGIDYSGNNHNNMQEREVDCPVIQYIGHDRVHIDELLEITGLSIGELMERLLTLEIQGLIRALPGNYYVRV